MIPVKVLQTPRCFRSVAVVVVTLCCLTFCRSAAEADASASRKAIQRAYDKGATALSLKFMDGMYSMRTLDFVARDRKGKPIDVRGEKMAMARILSETLAAKESVQIVTFVQKDSSHADCTVHDVTELLMVVGNGSKNRRNITLDTTSKDSWVLVEGRWRENQSSIMTQSSTNKEITPPGAETPTPSPSPSSTPKKAGQ